MAEGKKWSPPQAKAITQAYKGHKKPAMAPLPKPSKAPVSPK